MTKPKKREPEASKAKYQPTAQEQAAIDKYVARHNAAPPAPGIEVTKNGEVPEIGLNHPDNAIGSVLLMEALGTANYDFMQGLLSQLANAGSHGREIDEANVNFMLAVVKDIKPRDQLEAMLAAQMAAIHMTTMTFTRRLAHVENIPQQDSAERALNKLARTFATQMVALKRYRTGG